VKLSPQQHADLGEDFDNCDPLYFVAYIDSRSNVIQSEQVSDWQAALDVRRSGRSIVVCGSDSQIKKGIPSAIAKRIEAQAFGATHSLKRCPPHPLAGKNSLSHYQPLDNSMVGATYYESQSRRAVPFKGIRE
jgi:hypothetical protein